MYDFHTTKCMIFIQSYFVKHENLAKKRQKT